jgi:hypothetical protein
MNAAPQHRQQSNATALTARQGPKTLIGMRRKERRSRKSRYRKSRSRRSAGLIERMATPAVVPITDATRPLMPLPAGPPTRLRAMPARMVLRRSATSLASASSGFHSGGVAAGGETCACPASLVRRSHAKVATVCYSGEAEETCPKIAFHFIRRPSGRVASRAR